MTSDMETSASTAGQREAVDAGTTYEVNVPLMQRPGGKSLGEPLNANWVIDRWRKAERVRLVREAVLVGARVARIPKGNHLTVTLHYRPGDNRRRDADNLWPTLKACCDALARGTRRDWVGLELVPDDTPEYMTKRTPVIQKGPGERRMWLEVTVHKSFPAGDAGVHHSPVGDANADGGAE